MVDDFPNLKMNEEQATTSPDRCSSYVSCKQVLLLICLISEAEILLIRQILPFSDEETAC